METFGTEARRDIEFAAVINREASHLAFDGKKALQTSRVGFRTACDRPGDDHLVADISVHRAVVVANGLVDIEEEPGNDVVYKKFPHVLGEPRRAGKIEEHDYQLFANWAMIGPQDHTRE